MLQQEPISDLVTFEAIYTAACYTWSIIRFTHLTITIQKLIHPQDISFVFIMQFSATLLLSALAIYTSANPLDTLSVQITLDDDVSAVLGEEYLACSGPMGRCQIASDCCDEMRCVGNPAGPNYCKKGKKCHMDGHSCNKGKDCCVSGCTNDSMPMDLPPLEGSNS